MLLCKILTGKPKLLILCFMYTYMLSGAWLCLSESAYSSQPELHTLKITFPGVFVMLRYHGRELWNHE